MLNKNSHIALFHYDVVPEELLEDFCISVNTDSLRFEKVSQPEPSPQMCNEWLAVPAIAVFLMTSYFDGFLKEAGKDHYHASKKALKVLGKKFMKSSAYRELDLAQSFNLLDEGGIA